EPGAGCDHVEDRLELAAGCEVGGEVGVEVPDGGHGGETQGGFMEGAGEGWLRSRRGWARALPDWELLAMVAAAEASGEDRLVRRGERWGQRAGNDFAATVHRG